MSQFLLPQNKGGQCMVALKTEQRVQQEGHHLNDVLKIENHAHGYQK